MGGISCPEARYEPVGQVLTDLSDSGVVAACLASEGNCLASCNYAVCVDEAQGFTFCEPCERVERWSSENCPECLSRSSGRLDLACTVR